MIIDSKLRTKNIETAAISNKVEIARLLILNLVLSLLGAYGLESI